MKDRNITVHASPSSDPIRKYDFRLSDGFGGPANLIFNKDVDKIKKSDKYRVIVDLENEDGAKLQFSQDPDKVLWAKPIDSPDDACPDAPCYMPGVFEIDRSNGGISKSKIKIINYDPSVQLFAFALNFLEQGKKDGPDAEYHLYDPVGSNQNGGLPLFGSLSMKTAAAGAALGVLAAVFTSNTLEVQNVLAYAVGGGVLGWLIGLVLERM